MPERECSKCKKQDEWGCFAKVKRTTRDDGTVDEVWSQPAHLPIQINGEETFACPRQSIRENVRVWGRLLLLYGMYSKGHLPDKGAVVDQSNQLMELFRIMDDANAQCDQSLQEDSKRRGGGGKPGGPRK